MQLNLTKQRPPLLPKENSQLSLLVDTSTTRLSLSNKVCPQSSSHPISTQL